MIECELNKKFILDILETRTGNEKIIRVPEIIFYMLGYYNITSVFDGEYEWKLQVPYKEVRMSDKKINLITNNKFRIIFSNNQDMEKFKCYQNKL